MGRAVRRLFVLLIVVVAAGPFQLRYRVEGEGRQTSSSGAPWYPRAELRQLRAVPACRHAPGLAGFGDAEDLAGGGLSCCDERSQRWSRILLIEF
jgi:hypothetical protein